MVKLNKDIHLNSEVLNGIVVNEKNVHWIGVKIKMSIRNKDDNCAYCAQGQLLDAFGIHICDLKVSSLILFKEQSKRGRFIVAYKDHIGEMVNLTEEERNDFFSDVANVAEAIHQAFHPDKLNYGMYGDTGCHMHMHLVPKYKDKDEWGGTFQMNPQKTFLSDEEYEQIANELLYYLKR